MRWLVTTREFRPAEGFECIETVEVDTHPVEYMNDLAENGSPAVVLLFAMKLHPEDPELDR